jgi:hypothetical protein
MGRRFLGLWWLSAHHQKFSQHFELRICGCEMWSMHLLSQCLFDHVSSDMMHKSSQGGGVCASPCCFELLARHAHDERVLIWCRYPRKELRMVHGVPAVVSLLRVAIKHP